MKKVDVSYNEFHVSKIIRELCGFSDSLFSSYGNVIIKNIKGVRDFAQKLNALFDERGQDERKISAGSLNAMGMLDEIFHVVSMLYRRDKLPLAFSGALTVLDEKFGYKEVDKMLLEFIENFPATVVYNKKISAAEFLAQSALDVGTGVQRTNREATLEELILLHLANENPAFKPFSILFDDTPLAENPVYKSAWLEVQSYFQTQPTFGPFSHELITMLREPVIFSPNDLRGQLEYVEKNWASFFPELKEIIAKLLASLDLLSEEAKAAWHPTNGGGQLPDMAPYSYENLMKEYERFSPDRDWMPKVVLMAKTILVWLDQLSKKYKRTINRLDLIPDEELDILAQEGFTGLWLIGLWERSAASCRIKQLCGNPEAAASAYSLFDYDIAQNIGGWDALDNLRKRLWQRGIRLASDMVPNHTGMDSRWVVEKPDLFIQRRDNPFPQYTYNGENLSHDSRVSVYLEDHYYSKSDCAVVFKRVDNYTGDTRYIYHGNDGTGMPWNDTAQIDFLNPTAREEVIQKILLVARNFPIIRFDAAMVLAKKHIRRLWYPEPGRGGDIATRSETQLNTQQFEDAIPQEFWREVVDRVANEVPDTLLLAEAFWMMEGYFVRTLGMHRVYNSAFMNMLKKEENQKYRDTVKNTLAFDPQVLKRFVNFMNNPDEETAVAQFGKGDKYFGVCTLMITMPGLPMFGHGQIEGFEEKYGMEYTKAYKNEVPDEGLLEQHKRIIFPLMKKRYLFAQIEDFLFFDVWNNGNVNENIYAYSNRCGDEKAVVFYNNKYESASGVIKQSVSYAVKVGGGEHDIEMRSRTIGEGLGLTDSSDKYCIFRNLCNGLWYLRESSDICRNGLYVCLNGFETQVLLDVHEVTDTDGKWRTLCQNLAGKGVEDLEIAWQELAYSELYKAFAEFMNDEFITDIKSLIQPKVVVSKKSKSAKETVEKSVETKEKPVTVVSVLSSAKVKALAFYTQAYAFATDFENHAKLVESVEASKSAEKELKLFEKKFKETVVLAKECNAAKKSATGTLVKTISKKPEILEALLCIAVSGSYAKNEYALKWSFARKFITYFVQAGADATYLRKNLEKDMVLYQAVPLVLSKKKATADTKKALYEIATLLMNSKYSSKICGVNNYDSILWFNKELTELSLDEITTLCLFELGEKSDLTQEKEILKTVKTLVDAQAKAEYKVENFLQKFAPAVKAKKVKSTKTAKDTTKAKGEKSVASKTTVKSSVGKKTSTTNKASEKKDAKDKKPKGN